MNETHVCPNCGRRFKCDRPLQSRMFEANSPSVTASPWPTIQYEVYWGIGKLTDALIKTLAVWIPVNAIVLGVSMRNEWSPVIPQIFSVVSLAGLLRIFGKVPSWHNAVQTEPPTEPESQEPTEPEDKRRFVGWETETHTKTTQHMEWYTPPVPIRQMQSYALALVNRDYQWIGEPDLEKYGAKISGPNFRKLRRDWIERDWCGEQGGNRTVVYNRTFIRRIAFEPPK